MTSERRSLPPPLSYRRDRGILSVRSSFGSSLLPGPFLGRRSLFGRHPTRTGGASRFALAWRMVKSDPAQATGSAPDLESSGFESSIASGNHEGCHMALHRRLQPVLTRGQHRSAGLRPHPRLWEVGVEGIGELRSRQHLAGRTIANWEGGTITYGSEA